MDQSNYARFDEDEGASGGNFLSILPVILWQRKWWIIIPAVLLTIGGAAAAMLIPPLYRADAIMIVESPQLPGEVLGVDAPGMVDRRIALIRQQITARPDLIELIQRHGLYGSERASEPISSTVAKMRESIRLEPTQAKVSGARDDRTIAFTLTFEYDEPVATQAVTQDLMDRVLRLHDRSNVEQATNTVQFLTDQATGLEIQIADLQSQIARVNAENGAVISGGGLMIGGNGGSYAVQIAALQRDNQQLVQQRNQAQTSDTRSPIVAEAERQLAARRAVYADDHPDVVIARQNLEQARELAKENIGKLPLDSIDEQIAFNNSQIAALRAAQASEVGQTNARLAAQSRAPLVQQQLGELQTRLSTLNGQYEAVQNRLLSARAGVQAEDQQMTERLSVVEPPIVPDEPSWPDRPLIALIGIAGGLGLGFVLALGVELFLRPIRDPGALRKVLGQAPLGIIPMIDKKASVSSRRRWFSFPR